MSARRLAKASSRYCQDVLQRYLQDVFKTYHQVKLFLLARLQDVFDMYSAHFLRWTAKTVIYRTICLGHTSIKNLWSVYKICKSDKTVSSFNLSLNYNFQWLCTEGYLEFCRTSELLTIFAKKLYPRYLAGLTIGFWLSV